MERMNKGFEFVVRKSASFELAEAIIGKLMNISEEDGSFLKYSFATVVFGTAKYTDVRFRKKGYSYEFIVGDAQTFVITRSNILLTFSTLIRNVPTYLLYEASIRSFTGTFYPVDAFGLVGALRELTGGKITEGDKTLTIRKEENTLNLTITMPDDEEYISYILTDLGTTFYKHTSYVGTGSISITNNYAAAMFQVMLDIITVIGDDEDLFKIFKKLAPNGFMTSETH